MSAQREMHYFALLDRTDQEAAIRKLASSGMSEYGIASATKLSVEQVRRILAAHTPDDASDA